MGAQDEAHRAPPVRPDLPPWLALVAPLFGGGKENEAPEEETRAAEFDVELESVPWWRPLFWSPTTGLEAHEALQAALPLIGCVPSPRAPSNTHGMLKTAKRAASASARRTQRTSALCVPHLLADSGAHGARATAHGCTPGRGR
jgi:hypothetical protein